ncbi:MoaD/ThiS family protein [Pedobacter sp. UYP1]|uniref:MoaD/ThiS family protein n=1 Tax=Pedobacter sp. UYP1 TaxID=1756396 RepID=UPI0033998742
MSNIEIRLITFGNIAEFIPAKKITFDGIQDTDGLKLHLETNYPQLKTMKYKMAMDRQMVQSNLLLTHKATVAIMPPFSGG